MTELPFQRERPDAQQEEQGQPRHDARKAERDPAGRRPLQGPLTAGVAGLGPSHQGVEVMSGHGDGRSPASIARRTE